MKIIPLIIFALLSAALAFMLVGQTRAPVTASNEAKPFPTLTLHGLENGEPWSTAQLQGHVTLVNFFASWCTPCLAELPELVALKKQFPTLRIEGVVWNDEPETMRAWLKKNGNPYDRLWLDKNGNAAIALGIRGIPESYLIDAQGTIRHHLQAPLTQAVRDEILAPLIPQLQAEPSHAP